MNGTNGQKVKELSLSKKQKNTESNLNMNSLRIFATDGPLKKTK